MEQELRGRSKIGNLEEEWREYIASVPIGGNKKEIEELALKYLHEVSR